jgi:hypothetical protein
MINDGGCDERELQFDVRRLEPGDQVDVFMEADRHWSRGTFQISTAGDALIDCNTAKASRSSERSRWGCVASFTDRRTGRGTPTLASSPGPSRRDHRLHSL